MVFPQSLHFSKNHMSQTSDSEEDDDEFYQVLRRFIILSLSLFFSILFVQFLKIWNIYTLPDKI